MGYVAWKGGFEVSMLEKKAELSLGEIGELHRFLRSGFGEGSASLDEDILVWKYFGRHDVDRPVSFVMRDSFGNICAHVGATYTQFVCDGGKEKPLRAMFPTDWLSIQPGAGLKLMKLALADNPILYAIGGTPDANRALRAVRCKQVGSLIRMCRFPSSRGAISYSFQSEGGCFRKVARAARNMIHALAPLADEKPLLQLLRITEFKEADMIQVPDQGVHTVSSPSQLNHLLRHPRNVISGWRICYGGSAIGYALLCVLPDPAPIRGKIVECQLSAKDPLIWASLLAALTKQLTLMGATIITSLVSTQFLQNAFEINNYRCCGASNLLVRTSIMNLFDSPQITLSLREGDISYV
jgi:hypothetical protein